MLADPHETIKDLLYLCQSVYNNKLLALVSCTMHGSITAPVNEIIIIQFSFHNFDSLSLLLNIVASSSALTIIAILKLRNANSVMA